MNVFKNKNGSKIFILYVKREYDFFPCGTGHVLVRQKKDRKCENIVETAVLFSVSVRVLFLMWIENKGNVYEILLCWKNG